MSLQTMELFFSLLAVAANAAVVAIFVAFVGARYSARLTALRDGLAESLRGLELAAAFAVATVATLGSLYLSEIGHLVPCKLCWYQRIAMYPLSLILAIAAWRKDHAVRIYVATIAVIGGAISVYHVLLQRLPALEGGSCDPAAPCTIVWVRNFGFVTIPYMALSAFTLILALLFVDRYNRSSSRRPTKAETEPAGRPA